jgi:uncharacterized protein (DUF885 family)
MCSVKSSTALATLAAQYWEARMASDPLFATSLGDRRYDGKLDDITPAGRARVREQYRRLLKMVNEVPDHELREIDRVTRAALIADLSQELDYAACRLEVWSVDPLAGPQVEFLNVESYQPVRTFPEGQAMARRWRAMGPYLDAHVANLKIGLGEGKVAARTCVKRTVEEVSELLAKLDDDWPLLRPLKERHVGWSEEQRKEFDASLKGAVQQSVRPSYQSYLGFLQSEVLPHSRPDDAPGLSHLPLGRESYRRLIRVHTSLDLTAEELHEIGLREVSRINRETETLCTKLFGEGDRREFLHRLRTDPSLYFTSREQVEEKARTALARANSAIPKWFGRLPVARCEVVRMSDHEEKNSTIAYYRPAAADGSRPGRYYINTSAPATRPRYEAEVLAYHESVPGHHLQLAIAQEMTGLPDFRRHRGFTAFVEGWGLYTERLADEMGLYSSDLDRVGMLSYDAWRACRLVVDTGMHAKNWSRQMAIEFMLANTALAENNIVNEVDRYITWPGQALAYKVGQLEILRLRDQCKAQLGDRFDIREFHDVILRNGAVPLEILGHVVARYLQAKLGT